MANLRTCFGCVCSLQAVFLVTNFAVSQNEALELDFKLTRTNVTTFLGQPANLGCYAASTNSSLTYYWTKDNQTVAQYSNVRAYGDLLVVTPANDNDFGTYECNITNGVSSIPCSISLLKGLNRTEEQEDGNSQSKSTTGCVNVSVLMPVLAVAVMSFLLLIHLVVRGKRSRENQMLARVMKKNNKSSTRHSDKSSSRHSEASTCVIEETIELSHINGHASRSPVIEHASRSPAYGYASRSPVNGRATQVLNYEAFRDKHLTQS